MRDRSATRRRILDAAYALFYRHGYARIGVDAIAAKAGITKRTLYDHFRSKDELLAAVLDLHHVLAIAQIERWGQRVSGATARMIDRVFADLAGWAARPRWSGPGFSRLVMELADLPGHPARAIASRHKAAVEAWFARELARRKVAAPQARAREIVLLLEGATALMLIHGDRGYATAAAHAAKQLLVR
ncbi:MAG TPA: helix-turn-helix domain-containing protein [Xanthobacteraceae bacterium]|nr:helix-turn-helix domain-containing protein [Xanthobacteraceae bacterium]